MRWSSGEAHLNFASTISSTSPTCWTATRNRVWSFPPFFLLLLFLLPSLLATCVFILLTPVTALAYAKANFGPFSATHMREIQRLMSCFLYVHTLAKSPYADLVAPTHWLDVQDLFTRDCCSLMGLSQESALYISVTVGSVALPLLTKVTKMMQSNKTEWTQQNELPVSYPLSLSHPHAHYLTSLFLHLFLFLGGDSSQPRVPLPLGVCLPSGKGAGFGAKPSHVPALRTRDLQRVPDQDLKGKRPL